MFHWDGISLPLCCPLGLNPSLFRPGLAQGKVITEPEAVETSTELLEETSELPPTTTESEEIDVNFYYRLYNVFSGTKKVLEFHSTGAQRAFIMSLISRRYSQQFYFVPMGDDFVAIRNRKIGDEFSLDVVNDAYKRDIVMAPTGKFSGQMWKLSPAKNGLYRLFNDFTRSEKCLDVYSDNEVAHLSKAALGTSGQYWKLEKLGPVENF